MWYTYTHTSVLVIDIYIYISRLLHCKMLLRIGKRKTKRKNFSTQCLRVVGITEFRSVNCFFFFCTWIHHPPEQHLMSVAVHVCVQLQNLLISRCHWKPSLDYSTSVKNTDICRQYSDICKRFNQPKSIKHSLQRHVTKSSKCLLKKEESLPCILLKCILLPTFFK